MIEITDRMPTTDDVRDAYIESAFEGYEQEAAEAFDRWLAVHDAERDLAKAWDEGLAAGMQFSQSTNGNYAKNREAFLVNPYTPNA